MKLKHILYTSVLAVVLLAAEGCKKDKFDINSNPDDVTDVSVTPSVLLPGAQQATSTIIAADWTFLQMWMGYWARSGSYQSLTEIETYKFTNNFENAVWNDLYANANNYTLMVNKAKEGGQGMYEAIGRIMKSHNFQILVDVYNNVPYFEAFKGTAAATPKYDKGEDIYQDLFKQLDTAIELLKDEAAIDPAKNPDIRVADLVYGTSYFDNKLDYPIENQAAMWIKFANTLRLRMIMHLHNGMNSTAVAPGFNISEQVSKITQEGFLGADESAHLNPGFSGSKPNPYYRFYNTNQSGSGSQRDHVRANEWAIRYYKADGDPRINQFYVAPSAGHKGMPFGQASGDDNFLGEKLSTVRGPGLTPDGASSRAWILTSFESLFLQAEARERGVLTTGPTAEELLKDAVTESFIWLDLTAEDAQEYFEFNETYPDVDYNATGGGLITIMTQKWFAMNAVAPYETWADYRRTDYTLGAAAGLPAGPPLSIDQNAEDKIPVRLFYPQNEYNYNPANVAAQGTIDVFNNKVFWDLN